MNEFIKQRFSYLADNKKENAPELNVSYGIDKNFLYGAGVSISSVLINNSDINFVFHVFTDYVDDDYLKSFNETATQFNTSIIVYLIDPNTLLICRRHSFGRTRHTSGYCLLNI